jgi:TRAP-type C4-dicarboxylate transport system substrate-binding protein
MGGTMKLIIAFVMALALSLPFTGATGVAHAQTEIKIPMETPPGHIKTRSAIAFKETLEKISSS